MPLITMEGNFSFYLTVNVMHYDTKIRAYLAGHPGRTHYNQVWKNMDQFQNPQKYFSPLECVMCDTAYEPTWFYVPAFKCLVGDGLMLHPEHF